MGGENAAVRNTMQKYGKHLSDLWKLQSMEDISAKGKHVWAATRTHPNGTQNKLDCIVVSLNVARDLKAKVILIKPVTNLLCTEKTCLQFGAHEIIHRTAPSQITVQL